MLNLNKLFEFSFVRKLQCYCMECVSRSNQHLGTAPKIMTFIDEDLKSTVCLCATCILPAVLPIKQYENMAYIETLLIWAVSGNNHTYHRIGYDTGDDFTDVITADGKHSLDKLNKFVPNEIITRDLTCWCDECIEAEFGWFAMAESLRGWRVSLYKYAIDTWASCTESYLLTKNTKCV